MSGPLVRRNYHANKTIPNSYDLIYGRVTLRQVAFHNNFVSYPDHWPPYYNGCNEPCCFLQGPCVCGAWHDLHEWEIVSPPPPEKISWNPTWDEMTQRLSNWQRNQK